MNVYQGPLRWLALILLGIAMLELYILHRRGMPFDWRETLNSIFISIGQRLAALAAASLFAGVYMLVWKYRLFDIPMPSWWGIALLFVAQEFVYYWEHRLSHEVRWFWASHMVHHSPNFLNLSAAYRLSWTAPFTGQNLLFLPLIWLGFHPLAVFAMLGVNLLYQFWLHTELVPRLGWFDNIFNSPSNHRVHHAANLDYLDANYGGILIIFDRIFGTYIPEKAEQPCQFGLVHPLRSHNPLKIVFHEWRLLWQDWRQTPRWADKFALLYKAPGYKPGGAGYTTRELRQQRAASQSAAQLP